METFPLPQEILDHVVDLLYDSPETLKQCCLVSKSWVPRTRKHIFAHVKFTSEESLQSWKKAFPDPTNSPSYHTRVLTVECDPGDIENNNWVQGFSHVERLVVDDSHTTIPFSAFHQLAPSLKSLLVVSLSLPQPQTFALIRSLPFLEDLGLIGDSDAIEIGEPDDPLVLATTSPTLTGTLDIFLSEGIAGILRGLLGLPGGLRFRRVELAWCSELDLPQVVELVTTCSGTLEYFDLACGIDGKYDPIPSRTIH